MKTLERCQWRHSIVVIVNCEHISNFVLIVDFEQANVFEDKIGYTMRYAVVFWGRIKFIKK